MKADYPDIAPLDLGDMGYSGEESVYVAWQGKAGLTDRIQVHDTDK